MYKPQETEKQILEFWKKNKIFEKLRRKNTGKKRWSFIDGPITANNPMGVHHAWGRTYKDVYHRYKAMRGFDMRYQNGFDCQGLWVEREEEKDLGLKNKEDIEKFGILKFVKACRRRVEKFSKIQRDQSIRLGQWMDWDNSYYTMDDNNNLHNWMLLKLYFEKGWLFKGKDSVPWCWRCGTASSKHDIATEGYKEVTHPALFMQFTLKTKPDEYFLIFTTTPWTVPANVAIAVNANIDYVKIENKGRKYWLAKACLKELEGKYKVIEKKKGSDLEGLGYIMPYADLEPQKESPHKVVLWDLASEEEGTGIVHIAPGCGAEDFDLGKKIGLPAISPLDQHGVYRKGYGEFSLKKYSDVNKVVLEDLKQRRFVYKIIPYKHRYPHCWRCGVELVFRLVDEWYIKAKEIRSQLINENKKIKWFPEYGKKRQEEWFKNMGDWLISRKRYWGLPLPIWECLCGNIKVIGSLKELKEKAIDKSKVENLPEIHRPWIDEIKIKCDKCGKEVNRIEDVGDAWLDAGIVPFSTLGYLTKKAEWERWFPADLISENMPGQYRGWFNALMWASVAITGKTPFKAMFGYETLKDEKGEAMHKSTGNVIWFDDAVEKMGADPMRLLFCLQDPSQEMRFGYHVIKEPKNSLNILYNISRLLERTQKSSVKLSKPEDKWIISRLNSLITFVSEELEKLRPHQATRALQDFWLNDLSRGYIQYVRDRLSESDQIVTSLILSIYTELLKLCAPIMPFITEDIWQTFRRRGYLNGESVHLSSWPVVDKKRIDKKLELQFASSKSLIEKGLSKRDEAGIGLKWPLQKAIIRSPEKIDKEVLKVIAKQLNVKDIELVKNKEIDVSLDITMTPELEAEGYAREISRRVQSERKKKGLQKKDAIKLRISTSTGLQEMLSPHQQFLKNRTGAQSLEFVQEEKSMVFFTVKTQKIGISF